MDPNEPVPVDEVMKLWLLNLADKRLSISGQFVFLVTVEMLLIVFLGREQFTNPEFAKTYKEMPETFIIVLGRFLCAIFLHISLADELE